MTKSIITTNPATGEQLADYASQDWTAIDQALSVCLQAQQQWSQETVVARAEAVRRVAQILRDEVETHAELISQEMGKPRAEARAEVLKCATTVDFYADHAEEFLASRDVDTAAKSSYVAYEPLGLIFAIMPWNFPYWQVIRFAVPALIAGNGAVLKHAANVTGSALEIASIFHRAGLPTGIFTTLVPTNHDMVSKIIEDPRISAVTLTGSEKAGASVAAVAGRSLKKSVLELGGSDPFVVLADVPSIENIVPQALKARFTNTGQSCLCAKRFIVEDAIYDRFVELAARAVEDLVIGDPSLDQTQIGPLAKLQFVDEIDALVQSSIMQGATLCTGGERIDRDGYYYRPTVLSDVTNEMPVFTNETFGPVMTIIRARDAEHAIELANDTNYGLGATVFSAQMQRGLEVGSRITSGSLFVNGVAASDPRLPFGGLKLSGYGRELSVEGLREFTNIRTVWATELSS